MNLQFLGATEEVTGSCHLLDINGHKILLDCGLFQGGRKKEERNRDPFPFDVKAIDALVLSHAHIDHSGRIPLIVKQGFKGPIYTHRACKDLCSIMLADAAYINEKDTEHENRRRKRKGLPEVLPLYTKHDAEVCMSNFSGLDYQQKLEILPGVEIRLQDAGHILGSSIIEIWLQENGVKRKLVFSGDLGFDGALIMNDPVFIKDADIVLLESTYGDRLHRSSEETIKELGQIFKATAEAKGNILIPSFAVGRTQELLYLFSQHFEEWGLGDWQIFLDSPLAIKATEIHAHHASLHNESVGSFWTSKKVDNLLPNLSFLRTTEESINSNYIKSRAIFIAGSGMCTGGRILHHLKHNAWRDNCHIIIVGYQAMGTTGRKLVDGAKFIKLWGETIRVSAKVHTVGGISAHADQDGLCRWYASFENHPDVYLIHGEPDATKKLAEALSNKYHAPVKIAEYMQRVEL